MGKNVRSANEIDQRVGELIKDKRIEAGFSQKQLAAAIGISFQQLQKYENGLNRISVSRLYYLARTVGVASSYFFNSIENNGRKGEQGGFAGVVLAEEREGYQPKPNISSRERIELIRAYFSITSKRTRQQFLALMRSVGGVKGE